MAIYVESLNAPTAGGGIKTFIDTELWELVTTGVDDLHAPVAWCALMKQVATKGDEP